MKDTHISPFSYVDIVKSQYEKQGDPDTAIQQSKYMKGLFPFYGLKAPAWTAILKDIFRKHGIFEGELLFDFVRLCFDEECREMHYTGLQMLEKKVKKLQEADIEFLEECALTNSWWDTVDWVNKFVGIHFRRFPGLQYTVVETWIESDSIWLQRLATIHQLTYKEDVYWPLLQRMILRRIDSREFFVQKAQGWALRQYSKFNSDAVRRFIEDHPELSALARREGGKYL